jgi:hypothetical protein
MMKFLFRLSNNLFSKQIKVFFSFSIKIGFHKNYIINQKSPHEKWDFETEFWLFLEYYESTFRTDFSLSK